MERADTAVDGTGGATAEGLGLQAVCDMCFRPVSSDDCYQTELTAQGATCPTMMTMHHACYEAAASLWVPEGEDSTCRVDPLFPETAQWNEMQSNGGAQA
ncbi:MAG: hypothetical protein ACLGI2_09040 [Acidimicrobiia bacterium]